MERLKDDADVAAAQRRYGGTPAFLVAMAAELFGDRPAIIDELGTMTFSYTMRLGARCSALKPSMSRMSGQNAPERLPSSPARPPASERS